MKHHLSFSVFLLLRLFLRSSGLSCGQQEYPLNNEKCCRKCPPGTEMRTRCTSSTDTDCQPCEEGWHSSVVSTWSCKPCTICDSANGLWKVKDCRSTSDTVCACLPGYQPASSKSDEKRCDPCPEGHFSKGRDEACSPWTNCTATGRNTFLVGTKEDDAVCGKAATGLYRTELPMKPSSKRETVHPSPVTKPTSKPNSTSSASTILSTEGLPEGVKKSGYLLYILIAAALLLLLGGISLLKIFRRTKKYKEQGKFVEQLQKDGKNSFRIPVQEEQIDAKSSLVQN